MGGEVIRTDASGSGLNPEEYRKMFAAEDAYFWFVAKHRLLADLLARELECVEKPRVLDAGAGTGGFLSCLGDRFRGYGLDSEFEALRLCRQRRLDLLVRGRVENTGFKNDSFNAVVVSDVIEHLDDDLAAVREVYRILAPEGVAVFTVPGMPWLWSAHDEALGHRRRYDRGRLQTLMTDAGFNGLKVFSYMSVTAPAVVATRFVRKIFGFENTDKTVEYELPEVVNRLLLGLLDIELKLVLRGYDLGIGTTLVALGRK